MKRVLADVLKDQRNLGNKGYRGWKRSSLNATATVEILGQIEFDWDDTKHMITIENENAWNEYCIVLQNWGDIVDLCAKDRAIGHGAETTMDVDEAMSRETNEVEFMGLGATATIYLEEPSFNTEGKRQGSTSFGTHSHKRKIGEKEGITTYLDKMANSFD
ncbi:hypothetical protein JHK82_050592 [Glycine max]|nr:hypothetical protein JHK82_050592 [Glycine max]